MFDKDKIKSVQEEFDIDIKKLCKNLDIEFDEINQDPIKNAIVSNLITDLTYPQQPFDGDDIAWSILDHIIQTYDISIKTLSKLTGIDKDDIMKFHRRKALSIETKYQLICQLYRIINILFSFQEQISIMQNFSK